MRVAWNKWKIIEITLSPVFVEWNLDCECEAITNPQPRPRLMPDWGTNPAKGLFFARFEFIRDSLTPRQSSITGPRVRPSETFFNLVRKRCAKKSFSCKGKEKIVSSQGIYCANFIQIEPTDHYSPFYWFDCLSLLYCCMCRIFSWCPTLY